jgi:GGDEF domain-containing protein
VQLNLSVGVCGWEAASDTPITGELLFHHADRALLLAKAQGRNRVVYLPVE